MKIRKRTLNQGKVGDNSVEIRGRNESKPLEVLVNGERFSKNPAFKEKSGIKKVIIIGDYAGRGGLSIAGATVCYEMGIWVQTMAEFTSSMVDFAGDMTGAVASALPWVDKNEQEVIDYLHNKLTNESMTHENRNVLEQSLKNYLNYTSIKEHFSKAKGKADATRAEHAEKIIDSRPEWLKKGLEVFEGIYGKIGNKINQIRGKIVDPEIYKNINIEMAKVRGQAYENLESNATELSECVNSDCNLYKLIPKAKRFNEGYENVMQFNEIINTGIELAHYKQSKKIEKLTDKINTASEQAKNINMNKSIIDYIPSATALIGAIVVYAVLNKFAKATYKKLL